MTFEIISLVTVAFCVIGFLGTLYLEWHIGENQQPPPPPVKRDAGWRERKNTIIDSGWRKKDDL